MKSGTIVLARAEKTALAPTGHSTRFDGVNYRPEFKADWEGRACIWKHRATKADLEKARTFAHQDGWLVFVYPETEKDPLQKARDAVVRKAKNGAR